MPALLVTAFLIGLAGGVHCVAMCGGIVAALNVHSPRTSLPSRRLDFGRQLAYSLGRIASYACAGAIVGGAGGLGLLYDGVLPARVLLLVVANAIVVS